MNDSSVLGDFLSSDATPFVRKLLKSAILDGTTARQEFTFNIFNVVIDPGDGTVTLDDDLDVTRTLTLPADEFLLRLGDD